MCPKGYGELLLYTLQLAHCYANRRAWESINRGSQSPLMRRDPCYVHYYGDFTHMHVPTPTCTCKRTHTDMHLHTITHTNTRFDPVHSRKCIHEIHDSRERIKCSLQKKRGNLIMCNTHWTTTTTTGWAKIPWGDFGFSPLLQFTLNTMCAVQTPQQ